MICLEWPSAARHTGGVGRYVYRLAARLSDDVDLRIVTGPDPLPLDGPELRPLRQSMFAGRLRRHYASLFWASSAVAETPCDVVHSHGDDLALAYMPRHPPIVRTYYGRSAAEAKSGRWQRRINHVVLAATEHAVRPQLAASVGIGLDSVKAFKARALIPPVLPEDLPAESTERSDVPTIVFIGGYEGRKRGALALATVAQIRERLPGVVFIVVGPGSDRIRYPAWVEFWAAPSDTQIQKLLGKAWVLLAPSTYEGFGIPAWEAMGAGAAVVGSSNPGLDFLSCGGTAARVVTDDALPAAVESLLVDEPARLALVKAGRARAETLSAMAEPSRYLELYRAAADK